MPFGPDRADLGRNDRRQWAEHDPTMNTHRHRKTECGKQVGFLPYCQRAQAAGWDEVLRTPFAADNAK